VGREGLGRREWAGDEEMGMGEGKEYGRREGGRR